MEKNYYEILNVKQNASGQEIASAFKKLSRESQKAGNFEFQNIKKAYDILTDTEKRKEYDSQLKSQRQRSTNASSSTGKNRTTASSSAGTSTGASRTSTSTSTGTRSTSSGTSTASSTRTSTASGAETSTGTSRTSTSSSTGTRSTASGTSTTSSTGANRTTTGAGTTSSTGTSRTSTASSTRTSTASSAGASTGASRTSTSSSTGTRSTASGAGTTSSTSTASSVGTRSGASSTVNTNEKPNNNSQTTQANGVVTQDESNPFISFLIFILMIASVQQFGLFKGILYDVLIFGIAVSFEQKSSFTFMNFVTLLSSGLFGVQGAVISTALTMQRGANKIGMICINLYMLGNVVRITYGLKTLGIMTVLFFVLCSLGVAFSSITNSTAKYRFEEHEFMSRIMQSIIPAMYMWFTYLSPYGLMIKIAVCLIIYSVLLTIYTRK